MANDEVKKPAVPPPAAGQPAHPPAPAAAPSKPVPTQEEVSKALEELVVKAEAAGQRDDPAVTKARDILDRQPKK